MSTLIKKYNVLLFILLFTTLKFNAQSNNKPVAHYPLELLYRHDARKLFDYFAYDVSGNERHGNTTKSNVPDYNRSDNNLYDRQMFLDSKGSSTDGQLYDQIYFLKTTPGVTCTVKKKGNEGQINLPDIPLDYSNGVGVSFWVYKQSNDRFRVLNLEGMNVYIRPSGAIEFNVKDNSSDSNLKRYQTGTAIVNNNTWYNIALFKDENNDVSLRVYNFSDDSVSNVDLTLFPEPGSNNEDNTLLSTEFAGKLSNVRFFDGRISDKLIDNYRLSDKKYAIDGITDIYHHTATNMLDQFSFSDDASIADNAIDPTRNGTFTNSSDKQVLDDNGRNYISLNNAGSRVEVSGDFVKGSLDSHTMFDLENTKGFTVSFWYKLDATPTKEYTGGRLINPTEQIDLFAGVNASNQPLFGMKRVDDRLGVYRYTTKNGNKLPYYFWFYDDLSFRGRAPGWYHIVLSQNNAYMKVYMWPDENIPKNSTCLCNLPGDTECFCKRIDLETQQLDGITKWGIGSFTSDAKGPEGITDFKVYNYPMTDFQVQALHNLETEDTEDALFAFVGDFGCDKGYFFGDKDIIEPGYEWLTNKTIISGAAKTTKLIKSWNPEYVTILGDYDYKNADPPRFNCAPTFNENTLTYYSDFIDNTNISNNNFYTAIGNHDLEYDNGLMSYDMVKDNYNDHLKMSRYVDYADSYYKIPRNVDFESYDIPHSSNDDPDYGGRFYTFKRGNIRFFVLHSNVMEGDEDTTNGFGDGYSSLEPFGIGYKPDFDPTLGTDLDKRKYSQAAWLEDALQQSQDNGDKYQIVITHQPPITSSIDDRYSSTQLQQWPLYNWGVDAVLSGDDHWFEHFKYNDLDYIIAGNGGFPGMPFRNSTINPSYAPKGEQNSIVPSSATLLEAVEAKYGAVRVVERSDHLEMKHVYFTRESQLEDYVDGEDYSNYQDWDKYTIEGEYTFQIYPRAIINNVAARKLDTYEVSLEKVEDIEPANSTTIYPNPTNGKINIVLGKKIKEVQSNAITIDINSIDGKLLYSKEYKEIKNSNSIVIDLNSLGITQHGVYLLNISTDDLNESKKIVLKSN